jgi:hypothetical protein
MNNIKPYFWGPHYWKILFTICASYPDNPDKSFITFITFVESVKKYMLLLQQLLPCKSCRESYIKYCSEIDTNINDDIHYSNKDNFIKLIFLLRNKINKKLGIEYNITIKYFKFKINNMICISDHNVDSYANNVMDAPFIQNNIQNIIYNYLEKYHKVNINYTKQIINKLLLFYDNPIFDENNNLFKIWLTRNTICEKIIKKIYNNMSCGNYDINLSFKKDNELHIKLFQLGCSIIPSYNIKKILQAYN